MGWYKIGKTLLSDSKKIAQNNGNGDSFIYDSAPEELKDRFNVSSDMLTGQLARFYC